MQGFSFRLWRVWSVLCVVVFFPGIQPAVSEGAGFPQTSPPVPSIPKSQVTQIKPDVSLELKIKGGEIQLFQIGLKSGQFAQATISSRGMDLKIQILNPEGIPVLSREFTDNTYITAPIFIIAEKSGAYTFSIERNGTSNRASMYQFMVLNVRTATLQDTLRIKAQQLFLDADNFNISTKLESLRKAIPNYEAARSLWQETKDTSAEALTVHRLGLAYSYLGDKRKSVEFYAQSLALCEQVGDLKGKAREQYNLGFAYRGLGELPKAMELFQKSLQTWIELGEVWNQIETLTEIGNIHQVLGEDQKALEIFNQALQLNQSAGYTGRQAVLLHNIGMIYDAAGEPQKALENYKQALALSKEAGDVPQQGYSLNNIGAIYYTLGEKQKAIDVYNQALQLRIAMNDAAGQVQTLNYLGVLYMSTNEREKALFYFNQALELAKQISDPYGQAYALTNLGKILSINQKQKSLEVFQQALSLVKAAGDRRQQAGILSTMAVIYEELNEYDKALEVLNQALKIQTAIGYRPGRAYTNQVIGRIYKKLGQHQDALDSFTQSLSEQIAVGNTNGQALTTFEIAQLHRDLGHYQEARKNVEKTLELIEFMRSRTINQQSRTRFFDMVQRCYTFYLDLLMKMHKKDSKAGYDVEAFQLSEKKRARVLLELLAETKNKIRQGVDPQLVEQELNLQKKISEKTQTLLQLRGRQRTPEKIAELEKELTQALDQLSTVQTSIRQNSPRYAELTQPQPLSLKEIQTKLLDPDTLLLEYAFGEEQGYLWLVSSTSLSYFALPKEQDIALQVINALRFLKKGSEAFSNPTKGDSSTPFPLAQSRLQEWTDISTKLSQILLGPVKEKLGTKRLVIVGDNSLLYLPFAALPVLKNDEGTIPDAKKTGRSQNHPTSYTPLIAEHEIVLLPSASTLGVLRSDAQSRQSAPKPLIIFADPVFSTNDLRFSYLSNTPPQIPKGSQKTPEEERNMNKPEGAEATSGADAEGKRSVFQRLPGTRKEANSILSFVPQNEKKAFFDFAANQTTVTSQDLSQYRIIHFATHGFVNTKKPELSGLVFSLVDEKGQPLNGFLLLPSIFNLKLNADLVVLSACETGLGQEVQGEGVIGLTRGFMYAGTQRIVVSLWNVSDRATAELMERFYRGLLKQGMRPSTAMQQAQLFLFKETQWKDPYYWAAFQLQGEYR